MRVRWVVSEVHVLGAGNAEKGKEIELSEALALQLIAQSLAEKVEMPKSVQTTIKAEEED